MTLSWQFVGCGDAFRRLVLTHMSDDMLGHPDRARFETAEDGLVLTIG